MAIGKCPDKDCAPVEQIRGEMGAGDYFDVLENDKMEAFVNRLPPDYHEHVEIDETNSGDIRIICRKCHRTTGWNKADAPGMPGAGRDYQDRIWKRMVEE